MGVCLGKEKTGAASPPPKPRPGVTGGTNRIQGGSRVFIRTHAPSVNAPPKMIHLPQEILSPPHDNHQRPTPPQGRAGGVHKTLIRNDSGVLVDHPGVDGVEWESGDRGGLMNESTKQDMSLEDGQVAYMPQSFVPDPYPEPIMDVTHPEKHGVDNRQITHYRTGLGPRTDDLMVELKNMLIPVAPPTGGSDYMYNPDTHPAEFDAVNTLAISQLLLNQARRCLWESGGMERPTWRWGRAPLIIYPYGGRIPGARYCVEMGNDAHGFIEYGYHRQGDDTLFNCRSFGTIAHEIGHAILDGMKPTLLAEGLLDGFTLHEVFADLCAIFGLLDHVDICEQILVESGGDLRNKNFLPKMAESYAPQAMRNVDNGFTVSQVEGEPHSLSMVVTGAIYDVIADVFTQRAQRHDLTADAQVLSDVGRHLYGVTLRAFKDAPDAKTQVRDVIRGMISLEKDEFIKERLELSFERRELMELHLHTLPRTQTQQDLVAACCNTLRSIDRSKKPPAPPNVSIVPVW